MNVLKSEKLKLKKSGVLSISIFTPFICALFSTLFGGSYNASFQTIYWWMGVFLYLLFELIIYRNFMLEEKASKFFNLKSTNFKQNRIYLCKQVWTIYYGFIATLVMIGVLFFIRWSMPTNEIFNNSFNIILGLILIFISAVWMIPAFILLSNRINGLLFILFNFIITLLVAPFVAISKLFFLFPYTYPYKIAKYFFRIKEAGDVLNSAITNQDRIELAIGLLLSLALFFMLNVIILRRKENGKTY